MTCTICGKPADHLFETDSLTGTVERYCPECRRLAEKRKRARKRKEAPHVD